MNQRDVIDTSGTVDDRTGEQEETQAEEVVAVSGQRRQGVQEEVDHPARLLRIAGMVRSMLNEVQTADLDEAGRERLTHIHNQALEVLGDVVSDDLRDELVDVALEPFEGDETPTAAELRVAQAQLAGWLEGLFHGIQASIASQQMAAQQQLQQMRRQQLEPGSRQGPGHYL